MTDSPSVQSYLKKLKSRTTRLQSRFNRRFFVLCDGQFSYKRGEDSAKTRKSHTVEVTTPQDVLSVGKAHAQGDGEWRYGFTVLTRTRKYVLFAATERLRETWLEAFAASGVAPRYYSALTSPAPVLCDLSNLT